MADFGTLNWSILVAHIVTNDHCCVSLPITAGCTKWLNPAAHC